MESMNNSTLKTLFAKTFSIVFFLMLPTCYVNAQVEDNDIRMKIDVTDFVEQITGWEWLYIEDRDYKTLEYPTKVSFYSYPSHPQYRVIGNGIYDSTGKLVRWGYVIRKDYYYETPTIFYTPSKEEEQALTMLDRMYNGWVDDEVISNSLRRVQELKLITDDIRNNSLGTDNEPESVIDKVLNLLSWTKYNIYEKKGGEEYGPDEDVAKRIINQSKANHNEDMSLNKIRRIDDLNFEATFTNLYTNKADTMHLEFYQDSPYDTMFRITINDVVWMDRNRLEAKSVDKNIRSYCLKLNNN